MFKIAFILLLTVNCSYAGIYEDALAKNSKVFLYFYVNNCRTCKLFDSIYDNLKQQNKDYAFVKIDANTSYGMRLLSQFKGKYVPFIILTDSETKKSVNVNHTCVMDEVCLMRAMKSFKK